MIDATSFPDPEVEVPNVIKDMWPDRYAGNATPDPLTLPSVTVVTIPGGTRQWGSAVVNVAVNVYAGSDQACREATGDVLDLLSTTSNDAIHHIDVPAGRGVPIPRQTPPFQRYFPATVYMRGQDDLPIDPS